MKNIFQMCRWDMNVGVAHIAVNGQETLNIDNLYILSIDNPQKRI